MSRSLIFDYDDTLATDCILLPGVKEILQELHASGHVLYICSFDFCTIKNIDMTTVAFFDDLLENCQDVAAHDIQTVHVKGGGLSHDDLV